MVRFSPLLLILLGIAFLWLAVTGRLGVVLASIFSPESVVES